MRDPRSVEAVTCLALLVPDHLGEGASLTAGPDRWRDERSIPPRASAPRRWQVRTSDPGHLHPGCRVGDAGIAATHLEVVAPLSVREVQGVTDEVLLLRLARADSEPLVWTPGSHIDLRMPSGRLRQYSLCGDPADGDWRIGVLREQAGRGGSAKLHSLVASGVSFDVRGPRNHFPLIEASNYLFLAGGIGVTPILDGALGRGRRRPVPVFSGGRRRASMAFVDEPTDFAGERLTLLPQDESGLPDLDALLRVVHAGTAAYCCGPGRMIAAVETVCEALGITDRLHVERFAAGDELEVAFDPAQNTAFEVHVARTGVTVQVPPDQRLIQVLRDAVPGLSYDCEKGYCGACETRVLASVPEHRDSVLTDEERAAGRTMMICVGRCSSDRLVVDR